MVPYAAPTSSEDPRCGVPYLHAAPYTHSTSRVHQRYRATDYPHFPSFLLQTHSVPHVFNTVSPQFPFLSMVSPSPGHF